MGIHNMQVHGIEFQPELEFNKWLNYRYNNTMKIIGEQDMWYTGESLPGFVVRDERTFTQGIYAYTK